MSITRKPTAPNEVAIGAFISGAPDAAAPAAQTPARRTKKKISVDIDPALLERIDRAAWAAGISRNAALALGAARIVEELEARQTPQRG
jgi:hypothetical protein